MPNVPLTISLTIDDAPMVLPDCSRIPTAEPDWSAMDAIREGLQRLNVPHCVAFVIGVAAERNPGPLERWLEAGYELGNHTHDHVPAREVEQSSFLASVERCHALLDRLGAFARGRTKWFRFPLLSYGADGAARRRLRAALHDEGYSIAHASTDLYDHAYEGALGLAVRSGNPLLHAMIGRRFRRSARFSLWQSRRLVTRHFGPGVPLVMYSHFGRVSREGLVPLLEDLQRQGATWCSLQQAQQHEFYRRLDRERSEDTGLATADLPRHLAWRGVRKIMSLTRPLTDSWVRRLGPTLPALLNG